MRFPRPIRSTRLRFAALALSLFSLSPAPAAPSPPAASIEAVPPAGAAPTASAAGPDRFATEERRALVQVKAAAIALRDRPFSSRPVLLTLPRGLVCSSLAKSGDWTYVRASPGREGWTPTEGLAPAAPTDGLGDFLRLALPVVGGSLLGLGFLLAGLQFWRRRRGLALDPALARGSQKRSQNKIQLLLHRDPAFSLALAEDTSPLSEILRRRGYAVQLETAPEAFLTQCKIFHPHLLLSESRFERKVEELVEKDATLVNIPVLFLEEAGAGGAPRKAVERSANGSAAGLLRARVPLTASGAEVLRQVESLLRRSPSSIRYAVNPPLLQGLLEAGSLAEWLQFLAAVGKEGRLVVKGSAGPEGRIFVRQGRILRAEWDGKTGEEAVLLLLSLESGTFEFAETAGAPETGSADGESGKALLSAEELVLRWAKIKDEEKKRSGD